MTPATHMTLEFKGIDSEDDLKGIDHLWVWLQSLPFSDLVSSWTGNKLCLHKNTNDYVQYVIISRFLSWLSFDPTTRGYHQNTQSSFDWELRTRMRETQVMLYTFLQVTLFCHIFQIADAAKNYKAYRRVQGILIPGAESVAAREQWRHMSS